MKQLLAIYCVIATLKMNAEMIVIGKGRMCDARGLIQSATDAKRRHLARWKPIRGVLRVQFPPAGDAVCCADCVPKRKTRLHLSFFLPCVGGKDAAIKVMFRNASIILILTDSTNHDPGELIIVHYSLPCLM